MAAATKSVPSKIEATCGKVWQQKNEFITCGTGYL